MEQRTLVRIATFFATVVAAWGVLSLGGGAAEFDDLEPGQVAEQDYFAELSRTVLDTEATTAQIEAARAEVDPILRTDTEVQTAVEDQVNELFDDIRGAVARSVEPTTETTIPPTTTSSVPNEATTTVEAAEVAMTTVTGLVFLDVDGMPGLQVESESTYRDVGYAGIGIVVSSNGVQVETESGVDGTWAAEVPAGEVVVTALTSDDVPDSFQIGTETGQQTLECLAAATCEAQPVGISASLTPVDQVVAEIRVTAPVDDNTVTILAAAASDDIIRNALGLTSHLDTIRQRTLERLYSEFGSGVTTENLPQIRAQLGSSPPFVFYDGEGPDPVAGQAAGEVVAAYVQPNRVVDESATAVERDAREAEVESVEVPFEEGEEIAGRGERLTQLDIDAIRATSGVVSQTQQGALLGVLAVLVGVLGLYLSRFRQEFWAKPRMLALLGILIVLAAGAVRGADILEASISWYVLPAVAFGFMTTVLFDSRIAVLMALAVGVLAAAGTQDTGVAVYGALATLAPIPFVSSVSSRGAFRTAVVLSAAAAAVIAGATSWYFHAGPNDIPVTVLGLELAIPLGVIGESMAWAFGVSAVASLIALAALQFFESAFDITTSLSLLDLTDRNHEALQLLQEKAFGTFN
ncbi:MAG: hypothetical protein ACRDX9_04825, partial [Acidimicrobiia bacterium]